MSPAVTISPGARSWAATTIRIVSDVWLNTHAPTSAANAMIATPPTIHDGRRRFGDANEATAGACPLTAPLGGDCAGSLSNVRVISNLPAGGGPRCTSPGPAPRRRP